MFKHKELLSEDFEAQIERIKEKLWRLKREDVAFEIFGSDVYEYKLNAPLSVDEINKFEKKYGIKLPAGYALFLQKIGNGGAGPFYGLARLENSVFSDMDYPNENNKVNPSLPFPLTEPLQMDLDRFEEFRDDKIFQEKYWSAENANGLLRLCNFGCGIFINLIVNGQEYGNMWTDNRSNDGGIYPSINLENYPPLELEKEERLNFLDWYEFWLDKSLEKLENEE